jgi:hypothetical protein
MLECAKNSRNFGVLIYDRTKHYAPVSWNVLEQHISCWNVQKNREILDFNMIRRNTNALVFWNVLERHISCLEYAKTKKNWILIC